MKKDYSKQFYRGSMATVALFVILAILRITDVIAWSWWWVTAPIWIPFLLASILVILFFGLLGYYAKKVK